VDSSASLPHTTSNMPDPDDQMDGTGAGSRPCPPHHSPCNRKRSASPRACDRQSWRQESPRWGYNPVTDCIVHRGAQCIICSDYVMHVNDASVDDDKSYIDAQDRRQAMFVPHHQWLEERMALSRANDQLDRAENQQREDREEISRLQSRITALEDELSSVKANEFASVAKRVMDKPLTGVPAHLSLHSRIGPPSNSRDSVQPSTPSKPKVSGRPKPAPYTEDVPMGAPDKGKGCAVPDSTTEDTPMSMFSTTTSEEWVDPYLEALGSDDDEWDDFEEETQAGLAKATTSKTARIVQLILNGSYRNPTVGSSESSQEEGRIPTIFSQTSGEFLFVCNALEAAHNEDNGRKEDLLQAIRNSIQRCQDYQKKGTLSSAQKAMISQWQNPDWARLSKYNPDTGKMEMSGPTKAELHNKKIARFGTTTRAEGHQKMLLEVARRTGHLVGNEPHPHLGNMSSPRHEDHPLIWMEWAKHIALVLLKGLAPGPDGYPYPRHCSKGLLLSFVRRRIRTIKARGISPYIVLANINLLASWLVLGNTTVD